MSSHPWSTGKAAFQDTWLPIGVSFVYEMPCWGLAKWPPIGGWLLIRVAAHSRFYGSDILTFIMSYVMSERLSPKCDA